MIVGTNLTQCFCTANFKGHYLPTCAFHFEKSMWQFKESKRARGNLPPAAIDNSGLVLLLLNQNFGPDKIKYLVQGVLSLPSCGPFLKF